MLLLLLLTMTMTVRLWEGGGVAQPGRQTGPAVLRVVVSLGSGLGVRVALLDTHGKSSLMDGCCSVQKAAPGPFGTQTGRTWHSTAVQSSCNTDTVPTAQAASQWLGRKLEAVKAAVREKFACGSGRVGCRSHVDCQIRSGDFTPTGDAAGCAVGWTLERSCV